MIARSIAIALFTVLLAPATIPAQETPKVAELPGVADSIRVADLWIRDQLAYHSIPGLAVAVVHDGETIWAGGFGSSDLAAGTAVTPSTRFRLGSVSKLFTATAVMMLRDEGRLRLEDPVAKHLPWFTVANPWADRPAVTIEQLLTHTSGLPREAPFPMWTTHVFPTVEQVRGGMSQLTLISRPGEVYRYSNLGVALLGEIVTAASGTPWAEFVDRRILAPLGMTDSLAEPTPEQFATLARAYLRKRPDGSRGDAIHYSTAAISPAASVVSTAEDLAKFAAFHLALESQAPRPLSLTTRREMQRPHFVYPSWSGGRGLGFAVSRRDGRTYASHGGWIGGHRADLLLDADRRIAVVALTNGDDVSPGLFSRKLLDLVGGAIVRATARTRLPKVADPAWERFLGHYVDPWEWEHEVLVLDGGLVLYEHDYPPDDDPESAITRLTPTGAPGAFRMDDGEPVVFETDESGRVTRIRRRFEYLAPKP